MNPRVRPTPCLLLLAALALQGLACRSTDAPEGALPAADAPRPSAARLTARLAERRRPFVSVEYDPYRRDGTGSVTGQAFLRTRSGDVKFGAGNVVHLVPATSYSDEWFEREVRGGEVLEEEDARAAHYHWTSRADGFGGFQFDDLPAGNYYLACRITWEIPDPRAAGRFVPAGGWAWERVAVREGEQTRAVVTR
jgi:hypothetical protein